MKMMELKNSTTKENVQNCKKSGISKIASDISPVNFKMKKNEINLNNPHMNDRNKNQG